MQLQRSAAMHYIADASMMLATCRTDELVVRHVVDKLSHQRLMNQGEFCHAPSYSGAGQSVPWRPIQRLHCKPMLVVALQVLLLLSILSPTSSSSGSSRNSDALPPAGTRAIAANDAAAGSSAPAYQTLPLPVPVGGRAVAPGSGQMEVGPATCPAWLVQYERYHAAYRTHPEARYLVHRVDKENGGLGDRLRGMMFATRLAVATSRVVLFTWSQPHDVSEFMSPPRGIDWRVSGTGYDHASRHPRFFWLYDNRPDGPRWHEYLSPNTVRAMRHRRHVLTGGLSRVRDVWVTISTNEVMDSDCAGCPQLDAWGADATCLWHYLFQFQPFILEAAEHQRRLLFPGVPGSPVGTHHARGATRAVKGYRGPAHTPFGAPSAGTGVAAEGLRYIAVHLRLGGFAGEPEAQHRGRDRWSGAGNHLRDLVFSLHCGRSAARNASVPVSASAPLLLITDNDVLRRFVVEGGLHNVVTPSLTPVHLERAVGLPKEAHLPTFVELLLLGDARCLVMSDSGFSHQAYLYSRRVGPGSCSLQLRDCPDGL